MGQALLVDFGSTRIKSALWDNAQGVLDTEEVQGIHPVETWCGRYEANPEDYWNAFDCCIGRILARHAGCSVNTLCFCSEMHGFLLVDTHGMPLTGYISWQDQRSAYCYGGKASSTWDVMRPFTSRFRSLTGMRMKPGLPWINVADLAQSGELPAQCRLLTLPDWILLRGGCSVPLSDATMAAATGFFDIHSRTWSDELKDTALQTSRSHLEFSPVVSTGSCLGQIQVAGKKLLVYGGAGDLQTALYGAGFGDKHQAVVNLGTGSQVAAKGDDEEGGAFEVRLTCNGSICRCITHIPCGKSLAMLAAMVDNFSQLGGGSPIFWKLWQNLSSDEVLAIPSIADLNMFPVAWRYTDRGGTFILREDWAHAKDFLSGIAHSWCSQYAEAFSLLQSDAAEIILSGSLARYSPFMSSVLGELTGKNVLCCEPVTKNETLDGLINILENI